MACLGNAVTGSLTKVGQMAQEAQSWVWDTGNFHLRGMQGARVHAKRVQRTLVSAASHIANKMFSQAWV